ncbi:hypothetical protein [Flavobacterium sp. LPB0248]|uniref:hypothetical protein n=1 Tax=Flavobacterium sp. LPB0248 TaxID=2614441 RepID=UPI002102FA68|nr:hypothetical protein [Flavobacterium sp. LPB0248]
MKMIILIFGVFIYTSISNAQAAATITINDTRSVNDAPNFSSYSIRADFKERSIIGLPGSGFYSTSLTFSPWGSTENSGDKNHQLNFNNDGIFYRNAYPLDSQWGGWGQLLMTDANGNTRIGSMIVKKNPGTNDSHIYFGDLVAVSGQPSSKICFGGYGIQNAGFVWIPNSSLDKGKLLLSFGGSDGVIGNEAKVTFQSNGHVGIGTTNPKNELDVKGTIHSQEVKVDMKDWSDFVFKKEYNLPTLEEVEKHIAEKGHLENIPNEEEVLRNGINLGEMNAKLLQKIEELTLYMIEMKKENVEMKNRLIKLESK